MLKNYKGGYKYQLTTAYSYELPGYDLCNEPCLGDWVLIFLDPNSGCAQLKINRGYAWDGPSGPTYDTDNFMEGSLVHDALYQLMREGTIAPEHRKYADKLLYSMCRRDGMSWFRAKLVYNGVRLFGKKNALPKA